MRYSIFFLALYFIIISSCKSQNSEEQKIKNPEITTVSKSKAYNPKDLKTLSRFIDTLIIDRFYKEISIFKKDDSLQPNRIIDIVFVGSSSIRKWKSLGKDMKGLHVLNRGFGGSTVPEAIFYSDILFLKHKPKKIVFYSGDNDVSTLNSKPEKIIDSYKYLLHLLNSKLPNSKIYILSIKPSPVRWKFWSQILEVNTALENLCTLNLSCQYIDVSSPMIDSSGNIRKELFVKDGIHLNREGYKLWTDIIFPVIKTGNK